MTAIWLRDGRLAKGLTQKELSEKSNISVRSIQRIERGEITPRSYTIKTLAEILGLSYDDFLKAARQQNFTIVEGEGVSGWQWMPALNVSQRIILSIGIGIVLLFLALAFVAQSSSFPETQFESFLFSGFVIMMITVSLFFLWKRQ